MDNINQIKMMPEDVSAKIAAGEVIENPASVIKELVENSIDANSKQIVVEIVDGGTKFMKVSDDGVGISKNQVGLAFQRFATSKIIDWENFDNIATLGFRGEALPSISSVAEVDMMTKTKGQEFGVKFQIKNGVVQNKNAVGLSSGTSIEVRNLFEQLPARRKFLKGISTESSRISVVLNNYALAYPLIKFRFISNGKQIFATNGSGDLREVVLILLGLKVAESMLEVEPQSIENTSGIKITGLIGSAEIHRKTRKNMYVFVNGRWINNRAFSYTLQQAYKGFLPDGVFPVMIINISVPFDKVDVNVHPSKKEVRFVAEKDITGLVQKIIRDVLVNRNPVPIINSYSGGNQKFPVAGFTKKYPSSFDKNTVLSSSDTEFNSTSLFEGDPLFQEEIYKGSIKKLLPILRPIGQMNLTYVISEGPDGLYLIDQHAAHERVLYEKVKKGDHEDIKTSQILIEPLVMDLSVEQSRIIELFKNEFIEYGFDFEPFGPGKHVLRSIPKMFLNKSNERAVSELINDIDEETGMAEIKDKFAATIACHFSIRAGKNLAEQEITSLIQELENCDDPNMCPHGRPTMLKLGLNRIESHFGRT